MLITAVMMPVAMYSRAKLSGTRQNMGLSHLFDIFPMRTTVMGRAR